MLPFKALSHVSVTVSDLGKARRFYGEFLGLVEIPRPDFGFPGVWYTLGGELQLHVVVGAHSEARPVEPHRFDARDRHVPLRVADYDDAEHRAAPGGDPFHASTLSQP